MTLDNFLIPALSAAGGALATWGAMRQQLADHSRRLTSLENANGRIMDRVDQVHGDVREMKGMLQMLVESNNHTK